MKIKSLFDDAKAHKIINQDLQTIETISEHMSVIKEDIERLVNARKRANSIDNERDKAIAYHDEVIPLMEVIRYHIDKLELMVDNEMWPLPKYRELLFIR